MGANETLSGRPDAKAMCMELAGRFMDGEVLLREDLAEIAISYGYRESTAISIGTVLIQSGNRRHFFESGLNKLSYLGKTIWMGDNPDIDNSVPLGNARARIETMHQEDVARRKGAQNASLAVRELTPTPS